MVASTTDGAEAVGLVPTHSVDVVVMDLNLPTISGIDATSRSRRCPSAPAVLVVTMVDDDDTVLAALRAGARGSYSRTQRATRSRPRCGRSPKAERCSGPGVANWVLTSGVNPADRPSPAHPDHGLTDREREVLERIADGASNARIARDLGLSVKTVQNYVSASSTSCR